MYDETNSYQAQYEANRKKKLHTVRNIIIIAIAAIAAIILLASSIRIVPEGFMGVRYTMGKIDNTDISTGFNIKAPFVQRLELVDMRQQVYESNMSAYTKDTQTVEDITSVLNYSYSRDRISDLIRSVGIRNVESKIIVPAVNSVAKNDVGKYKAEELVQNRASLQEQVETELRDTLGQYGIVVHSYNIKNIDFEDSFEAVISDKVKAEQDALKKQNETKTKEEEAKQLIIAAEADAQAKKLAADAEAYTIEKIQQQLKTSPEYNELQKIQKWDGHFPQIMGDTINPFVTMGSTTP